MINGIMILWGIIIGLIIQAITFLQLQGPIKWPMLNKYYWALALMGVPVSMIWMYYAKMMSEAFGGQIWPQRLIGFGLGAIVFALGSWYIFKEPLTTKTIVCLVLALIIVLIQIIWK